MVLPNQLTTLRLILSPVFFFLFLSENPVYKQIALVIYFIAAITDWYDGWLARKFNYITNWGKFMDPLADKALTSSAFLAFVFLDVLQLWMVLVIIVRDFLITGLRIYADLQNKPFVTNKLAKIKTFVQMVFIFYLLIFFTLKTVEPVKNKFGEILDILTDLKYINYVMLVITLFTFYTGVQYLIKNKNLIKGIFK